MKLMFGVESVNDVVAYCGLIEAILKCTVDAAEVRILRPASLQAAATFAREAHRLEVAGVVLALDNDGVATLHESHGPPSNVACRHCLLLNVARVEPVRAWPRPLFPRLGFVFGVPVQTLETWLLLAKGHPFPGDPHAVGRRSSERRLLKKWLYGAEKPSSELMQRVSVAVTSTMDARAVEAQSRSFAHFSEQVRSELAAP